MQNHSPCFDPVTGYSLLDCSLFPQDDVKFIYPTVLPSSLISSQNTSNRNSNNKNISSRSRSYSLFHTASNDVIYSEERMNTTSSITPPPIQTFEEMEMMFWPLERKYVDGKAVVLKRCRESEIYSYR